MEADAAPTKQQLGTAAVTWAAVSLADKLDSVAGMFAAGERPTGSRDPLGLRRQTQGAVKILADLRELTGLAAHIDLWQLVLRAAQSWSLAGDAEQAACTFIRERVVYLFEQRGFDIRNIRAVVPPDLKGFDVVEGRKKLEALAQMSGSEALLGVATLFKRVKNITKGVAAPSPDALRGMAGALTEPAEKTLLTEVEAHAPAIRSASDRGEYRDAFAAIAALQPSVAKFFDDVLVMAEDEGLRNARLALVATLRDLVLGIADISEIVTES